jgi:hypothetical protein
LTVTKPIATEQFAGTQHSYRPYVRYVASKSIHTLLVVGYSLMDSSNQSATAVVTSPPQSFSVLELSRKVTGVVTGNYM